MNKQKIVILGHSGFIGTNIEKSLSQNNKLEIIGRSLPNIDLTDEESTAQLANYVDKETIVILLAAVKRQFGDTVDVFRKNMQIVENVCKLLLEKPVKKIIFLSSAAVYGEETENTNISEESPINPTSYYGIAKYSAERILKKACFDNQFTSLICLRPPLIYGPGDEGRTYGPAGFTAAACEDKEIILWGDGTERREFIYVNDLCRLIEVLLNSDFSGELNVVSGQRYCFADIIDALQIRFSELTVNSKPRSKEKANNAFVANKIKSILPPEFRFTSLEEGLDKLIKSNQEN
jgi:UDP-glucose 4-epimerase